MTYSSFLALKLATISPLAIKAYNTGHTLACPAHLTPSRKPSRVRSSWAGLELRQWHRQVHWLDYYRHFRHQRDLLSLQLDYVASRLHVPPHLNLN